MIEPSDEASKAFGVRPVAPLGGRLNQHWLVASGRKQLVLRRWSPLADDVYYELRLLDSIAALGWPVAPALDGPIERAGHL